MSSDSNNITQANVYKIFDQAYEQMKNVYMYMSHDENFYYFKHQITRNYIKIERIGEE